MLMLLFAATLLGLAAPAGLTPAQIEALELRAQAGEPDAECALGTHLSEGDGAKDYDRAYALFLQAAEQGHVEAQRRLGRLYHWVDPRRHDFKKAAHWYAFAAQAGDAIAQNNLAMLYDAGLGVPQDKTRAVAYFLEAARGGSVDGQNWLGLHYQKGDGVERDCAAAALWFERASNGGSTRATFNLGNLYMFTCVDRAKALPWYRRSCEQDQAGAACIAVGALYYFGDVKLDHEEALRWFRKGDALGAADSRTFLGDMYLQGDSVPTDLKAAARLLRLATDQGDDIAACNLGTMYWYGQGVAEDDAKACELYRESGTEQCQFNLAICYRDGRGVERDNRLAWVYFSLAAEGDINGGEMKAKAIWELLSPADRVAAERLLREQQANSAR